MEKQVGFGSRQAAGLLLRLALALLALLPPARATPEATGPYQATALVTGTDMRQRPEGFARCLVQVLVNVSGEPRLAKDPRVEALALHADRLVQSYFYRDLLAGKQIHDEQGSGDRPYALTVGFDPAQIDKTLADLGERPWRGGRPTVVPVLRIRSPTGSASFLSAENPAAELQRASFAEQAKRFALGARIPGESELRAWGAGQAEIPGAVAALDGDAALVVGTLDFTDALPGWIGSFSLGWQGAAYAWSVKAESYDEAFRAIMRGAIRVASGHGAPE